MTRQTLSEQLIILLRERVGSSTTADALVDDLVKRFGRKPVSRQRISELIAPLKPTWRNLYDEGILVLASNGYHVLNLGSAQPIPEAWRNRDWRVYLSVADDPRRGFKTGIGDARAWGEMQAWLGPSMQLSLVAAEKVESTSPEVDPSSQISSIIIGGPDFNNVWRRFASSVALPPKFSERDSQHPHEPAHIVCPDSDLKLRASPERPFAHQDYAICAVVRLKRSFALMSAGITDVGSWAGAKFIISQAGQINDTLAAQRSSSCGYWAVVQCSWDVRSGQPAGIQVVKDENKPLHAAWSF